MADEAAPCPYGCAPCGLCVRGYAECVQAAGHQPEDTEPPVPPACAHGVTDNTTLHWTCCGRHEPLHVGRDPDVVVPATASCPAGCAPGGRCVRGGDDDDHGWRWTCCGRAQADLLAILPAKLRPLFEGPVAFHTRASAKPGNGLPFHNGGRLSLARQQALWQLKCQLIRTVMPHFTAVLAGLTDTVGYYATGSGALNYHLQRRGVPPIPTDDLDVKFADTPGLQDLLGTVTSQWLETTQQTLAAMADEWAAAGLAVHLATNTKKGVHCVHVQLRDTVAPPGTPPIAWNVAEVGPWDYGHWDARASTELTAAVAAPAPLFAPHVRVLREAAVVGDLRVDWPRTATTKAHRRRLKAQYWLFASGAPELPPDESVQPIEPVVNY